MATCSKSADITVCAICLETLNVPKYLPCLHTFCENCIASHIASGFEKGNKTNVDCPVCRATVSTPTENCSPDEWAKELPLNFLIVGLMEKQKIERAEKQCMSCERLEKSSQALFVCVECSDALCENCYQCHKANRFTSRHKTVSITNISEVEKSLNFFRNDCLDHRNEELKLYCIDHDVPCCSLCVSVSHRKCNEVVTVDQAAKGFLSAESSQKVEKDLANIESDASLVIEHNKKCEEHLDTQYDTGIKDIESYCNELVAKVDSIKQKRKDELTKLLNEKKERVETNLILLENLKKKIENEKEILATSLKKATDVQVMIETKKLRSKQEDHTQTILKAYEKSSDYNLMFKCNQNVEAVVQHLEEKCRVECEIISCSLDLLSIPSIKLKLKNKKDFGYQVTDCFCSKDDKIILLTSDYDQIKICDIHGAYVAEWGSYYKMDYGYEMNTAIAEGGAGEMAIMDSNYYLVEFMNSNGDYMNAFNFNSSYGYAVDIIFYPDNQRIAIGFNDRVCVITKSGKQVTSFTASRPKHLCMNSLSQLYYAEANKIVCKTMEGEEVLSLTKDNMVDINGMTLDAKGNIYVSSAQRNTVSKLSANGSIYLDILTEKDGLSQPSTIRISPNGKSLLVINNNKRQMLLYDIL